MHLILRQVKDKGISVNDIFSLSQREFASLFPDFGKGRFSKVQYAHFHTLDESRLKASWDVMVKKDIRMILFIMREYPRELATRLGTEAPVALFIKGQEKLLQAPGMAIVGSRNAGEIILRLTQEVAQGLAEAGFNVVSGHARGVDTHAHTGALQCGGTTTAVLSEGLLNFSVRREIREVSYWERNSLFLSQFLPKTRWAARNAMMRNKVVVGLSKGVVVMVSGPERDAKGRMSGTFHAARTAMGWGMPVFVLSPEAMTGLPEGNKALIERGAQPFSSPEELLKQVEIFHLHPASSVPYQQPSLFSEWGNQG